jgi:hypothetical protein
MSRAVQTEIIPGCEPIQEAIQAINHAHCSQPIDDDSYDMDMDMEEFSSPGPESEDSLSELSELEDNLRVADPGRRVQLQNRDPNLPVLYEVSDHPLRKKCRYVNKTYVYLQDTSVVAMKQAWEVGQKQKVLNGKRAAVAKSG